MDNADTTEYRVYANGLQVAGVEHYRQSVLRFMRAHETWIELKREPWNVADKNAIKVLGCAKHPLWTRRWHIGYVPRTVAKWLVDSKVDSVIVPRLLRTYEGAGGYLEVQFQILGPVELKPAPLVPAEGAHYSEFVPQVEWLKSKDRVDEAIELLRRLVPLAEAEAADKQWSVASWYYEQLAIIYRRRKQYADEVAILERYERQKPVQGALDPRLAARLVKARQLAPRAVEDGKPE